MPRKTKCPCKYVSSDNVLLEGTVQSTQIIDSGHGQVQSTLYTYFLTILNHSHQLLCNVGLYLDVRTLQTWAGKPRIQVGFCDLISPNDVSILLSSANGGNDIVITEKERCYVGVGRFMCLPTLKPGKTVITVIFTVEATRCCDTSCTLLPALFSLKLRQCCDTESTFCTSILIGCQPQLAKCIALPCNNACNCQANQSITCSTCSSETKSHACSESSSDSHHE